MSDIDRVLRQLRRRSWEKMRESWLSALALPDLNSAAGLEDILDIERIAKGFLRDRKAAEEKAQTELATYRQRLIGARPKKGHDEQAEICKLEKFELTRRIQLHGEAASKREKVPGVKVALFAEGLRLAEKAFHVLGCAESDVHKGNRSWSLSSAYQASFFASKALLALCGIGFVEVNGKTVVVDVFPDPLKSAEDYTEATFSHVSNRFDHRAVWLLFQRTLAITVDAPWPKEAVDKLKAVEDKHFAKQRNDMQYRNMYWPFDDLFAFVTEGDFGNIKHWNVNSDDLDFDRPDISIVVGFYIMKMNLALLNELGVASARLRPHVQRFFRHSLPVRHPIYHELLPFA